MTILPFYLFISVLHAQVADSAKLTTIAPAAEYFPERDFVPFGSMYKPIDTLMEGVQQYFPNAFPYSLGLANRKLMFEPSMQIGFRSGFDDLDIFGYNKEEMKYYRARTPYTEVFGLFGMKKEQYSRILHTQNISKQWNIALNMLRIRSEGFYQRQNCTDNNISLSTNYVSKSGHYSLLANGIISSLKSDENGGIRPDSLTEDIPFGNKKLVAVELLDARSKRLHREFYVKQSLYFGRRENVFTGDSIASSHIKPTTSIFYSFRASDDMFAYTEAKPDSDYYQNNFFDSTHTLDSTHIEGFATGFGLQTTLFKAIKINVGMDRDYVTRMVQYNDDSLRTLLTSFSDQKVSVSIGSADKVKGFFWNIGKQQVIHGSYEGDYNVRWSVGKIFKNHQKISLESNSSTHSVPFIYEYYNSNHFAWSTSFNKSQDLKLRLSFSDMRHRVKLSIQYTRVSDFVYFDSTFTPASTLKHFDAIGFYSCCAEKTFHLKHFGFNNKISYTPGLDGNDPESVIHLPKIVSNHSLYYQGQWFKKATDVQIGLDVAYFSSYYADNYMPALGLYYVQYTKKMGNYPYIDFFFNMKIKHAVIFFKSEHLNSGFMGQNYYIAPHMPAPDRSIKVGIKWVFYN